MVNPQQQFLEAASGNWCRIQLEQDSERSIDHLGPGVVVDERVDHLPRLHEEVGHIDHQRLAESLRVVVLMPFAPVAQFVCKETFVWSN